MNRLSLFSLIIALLTLMPGFHYQSIALSQQRGRTVIVMASNILSDVAERKKKQPAITAKGLAAFGNELIEKKGFDYDFDLCDLISARDRKSTANVLSARHPVSLINGETLTLKLSVANQEGLCGECWTAIPSRQVNEQKIHFFARFKDYRVRRPASFLLDTAELVDATMKRVLRKWHLPYQGVPVGISRDATKLYLAFNTEYELDDLVLELSEDGRLAFRERAEMGLQGEGVLIENHPKDPRNSYLSFISFQVGNTTHIVRFTAPCT